MLTDVQNAQFECDWAEMANGTSAQGAVAERQHQHLEDELRRLALLSPSNTTGCAKPKPEKLGVQVKTLDGEVVKPGQQVQAQQPATKEPPRWAWLEKHRTDPVTGAELLVELSGAIRRYVMLDQNAASLERCGYCPLGYLSMSPKPTHFCA
jgi:hypothetical protein